MSGYVVAPTGSGHRKNKNHSKEHVQLAANSTQLDSHCEMIEHATCELFQVIPIGSTFFIEDNGEKSQDCMLDAQGDRLWFPVHPKPPPVSSKCTGTWILVLLQFFKRGSLKSKREGLSEGLL